MKKLLALLLAISLLLALPVTAAADGDGRSFECDNVLLTVTGCCTTPGADGAPRLTLFLSAGNKNDAPREVRAEGCIVGPCELPVNLSLTLDAWESREAMLVIPLTALSFFDLSHFNTDFIRLRLSVAEPGAASVSAGPMPLHVGELPRPERRLDTSAELYARFGARVLALGADFDGRFYIAWFLFENNNEQQRVFPASRRRRRGRGLLRVRSAAPQPRRLPPGPSRGHGEGRAEFFSAL